MIYFLTVTSFPNNIKSLQFRLRYKTLTYTFYGLVSQTWFQAVSSASSNELVTCIITFVAFIHHLLIIPDSSR